MTDLPGLHLERLADWLGRNGHDLDVSEPLHASLLAGGRSNVSYVISDAAGRRIVLRRPPLGHVMPSAHDMDREYRVLSGLNRVGYPAPRALGQCSDETVIGAPFMLMDFVDGMVIDTAEASQALSVADRRAVSARFVDALAQLHSVDVGEAGLQTLGRPDGYLGRQVSRWQRQWELSQTAPVADMDALGAWLQEELQSIPQSLPWSLVHGDYRLDNMIVNRGDLSILAVLDWEMSTLGDPVLDLAVALTYWSQPGEILRHELPVADGITDPDGFWTREQLVNAYADASGAGLDHLDFCTALACYKLATIMESIHLRTTMGQQLGAAAQEAPGQMGIAARALAAMGVAVTRHGALAGLAQ